MPSYEPMQENCQVCEKRRAQVRVTSRLLPGVERLKCSLCAYNAAESVADLRLHWQTTDPDDCLCNVMTFHAGKYERFPDPAVWDRRHGGAK